MSVAAARVPHLLLPTHVSFCAVPATHGGGAAGGTADAERYITQASGGAENIDGWPSKMTTFFGLMPSWEPETYLAADEKGRRFYPIPAMPASWAVAPVPYEVFNVVKEEAEGNGAGNTFTLTWHDPSRNAVFRQPRDAMTSFGQGASYMFNGANLGKRSDTVDANIRASFFMKLDGSFTRMEVFEYTDYYSGTNRLDGGHIQFKTMNPPPTGSWFHYDAVVAKGKYPRSPGPLEIRILGRGNISIRDVAVSTTNMPPNGN
jgi:hypothetical protein